MQKIIWTNGRWAIDNFGIIWLCPDVTKRNVDVPRSILNLRDKLTSSK